MIDPPPDEPAARAGADVERTAQDTDAVHHPKTQPGPVGEEPDDAHEYLLTTDHEAQTDDTVIRPENS